MLHEVYHVITLVLFLAALGAAFLGVAGPLILPERSDIKLPALRTGIGLLVLALLSLVVERLIH